jgi:hypothetical protein
MSKREKAESAPARERPQQKTKTKGNAEQLLQLPELDKIDKAYASLKGTASAMSDEVRAANETYGGLQEGVHIAGYAFARAMSKLEWLLAEDRWREVGDFRDVNAFLDSLQLDELRMVAEQRKRVAKRIKELTAEASNRSIARALGVSHQTVCNDLRGGAAGRGRRAARLEALTCCGLFRTRRREGEQTQRPLRRLLRISPHLGSNDAGPRYFSVRNNGIGRRYNWSPAKRGNGRCYNALGPRHAPYPTPSPPRPTRPHTTPPPTPRRATNAATAARSVAQSLRAAKRTPHPAGRKAK